MNHLGKFELKSTNLRVTDPCYTKDTWCSGVIENAIPGIWNVFTETEFDGRWHRVKELCVWHSTEPSEGHAGSSWRELGIDVGVDSGTCGFFDDEQYPEDPRSDENEHSFFLKLIDNSIIDFGCCSSSGYGDGSYACQVLEDMNKKVIAAKVIFISDEEEEDCPENEDGYWNEIELDEIP